MLDDNLWNQKPERMSPKFKKFSSVSDTFKKQKRDLSQIKDQERELEFRRSMRNLL